MKDRSIYYKRPTIFGCYLECSNDVKDSVIAAVSSNVHNYYLLETYTHRTHFELGRVFHSTVISSGQHVQPLEACGEQKVVPFTMEKIAKYQDLS